MTKVLYMMPSNGNNSVGLSDVTKKVRQLGADSAAGKDSLPGLAITVVSAAAGGAFTADDLFDSKGAITPLGDGVDFAEYLYTEFAKAESKKQVHTENGTKANVSKLRQLGKMGMLTTCDPISVVDRTMTIRNNMVKVNDVKVFSAYPALVSVARAQLALDRDISDDEITSTVLKPSTKEKGLEAKFRTAYKVLEDMITNDKEQSDEVINAADGLVARAKDLGWDIVAKKKVGRKSKTNSSSSDEGEVAEEAAA